MLKVAGYRIRGSVHLQSICVLWILTVAFWAQSAPAAEPPAGHLGGHIGSKDATRLAAGSLLDCRARTREGVKILTTSLGGVPAVLRIPPAIVKAPILLWHGFGPPNEETALMRALPLDDVPAIKVYLGLPLFGLRTPPGGIDEFIERQTRDMAFEIFEPVVMGAASELTIVKQALVAKGCITRDQEIGLFGFSAGGAAVLYALAERPVAIAAAVTLNASTGLTASMAAYEKATGRVYPRTAKSVALAMRSDAVLRAEDIAEGNPPPALMIVHGSDDVMLPAQMAIQLDDALRPHYATRRSDSRLRLLIQPGLAHGWVDSANADALRAKIAEFFNTQL